MGFGCAIANHDWWNGIWIGVAARKDFGTTRLDGVTAQVKR